MSEQHDAKQTKPRPPKRAPASAAAEHAPYLPTPWENADALSMKRLSVGEANPIEQRRAFAWIMRASGYLDQPYRPGGEDGRRDTDFALGKAQVGRELAKLVNIDLAKLRGSDGEQP